MTPPVMEVHLLVSDNVLGNSLRSINMTDANKSWEFFVLFFSLITIDVPKCLILN